MNTALVMDIAVGAVLVFSAVVKGTKGLYKYMMPLLVLLASIVGALILSRVLTPVVTEAVYPKVEDRVVEMMQEKQAELQQDLLLSGEADVLGGKVKELLPLATPIFPRYVSIFSSNVDAASAPPIFARACSLSSTQDIPS